MLCLVLVPLPLGNLSLKVRLLQDLVPVSPGSYVLPAQPTPPTLQERHEVTVQEGCHIGLPW